MDQWAEFALAALATSWVVMWLVERAYRRRLLLDPGNPPIAKPPGIIKDRSIRDSLRYFRGLFTREHRRHPNQDVRTLGDLLLGLYALYGLAILMFAVALVF